MSTPSPEEMTAYYYRGPQVQEILGINRDRLNYLVRSGQLTRITILGKPYYPRREVDRLAASIAAALLLTTAKDLEFKAATERDVEAEIRLAHLIYGKRALRPEAQRARRQLVATNPECTWLLYDRDLLAASINIVPVDSWAIEQFRQGVRGWLFVPDHVQQFQSGSPLECIIIDFMTTPSVAPEKRNFYAQVLLRELATTTMPAWGARGVQIARLYACGSTDAGRHLLRNKWFRELGEPVKGRVIFELDNVQNTDLQLLRPYQEALADFHEREP